MRLASWLLPIALVFACVVSSARGEVVIRNDRGGDVLEYYARYQALQSRGERVVVDGDCLSACTLLLGLVERGHRCFTGRARFGFHAAWDEAGATTVQNPIGTAIFLSTYPLEILRWLDRHGGLRSKVLYLEGKELAAMYPPCKHR